MPYHRSEEHTSELQSHDNLVCRLLLEKKTKTADIIQLLHALCQDNSVMLNTFPTLHLPCCVLSLITFNHVYACLFSYFFFFLMIRRPPRSTLFPYTTSSD